MLSLVHSFLFFGKRDTGAFLPTQDGELVNRPPVEMLRLLPRSFDSLEVWLLVFCGAYGLLVSWLLRPEAGELKLLCTGFLLLGLAKRIKPARTKLQWFGSAMVTLGLTGVLYLAPTSGGSGGPFFYLLILLAMGYPLVMERGVALMFTLAVIAVYFVGIWNRDTTFSSTVNALRGGLLVGICLMSMRLGAVLRRAEETMDAMRRDTLSFAYNDFGLQFYGGSLLRRCQREQRVCSVVLLRMPHDWFNGLVDPRAPTEFGLALQDIAREITYCAPTGSLLARVNELEWALVVPGKAAIESVDHLTRRLGRPLQVPFGAKLSEWFVVISPCAVQAEAGDTRVAPLLERARQILSRGVLTGAVL